MRFNLPNALPRDVELLANLPQGVRALTTDAETHAHYRLLPQRECFQDPGNFSRDLGCDYGIRRRDPAVFNQLPPGRIGRGDRPACPRKPEPFQLSLVSGPFE